MLEQATALDPRFAEHHYRSGKALFALNRFADAKAAFLRAVEEDVCPLRAPQAFADAVVEVAHESGSPVVDFPKLLETRALSDHGHRLLGDEYFLDHVHPRIAAHGILGAALAEKILGPSAKPILDQNKITVAKKPLAI